MLYEVDKSRSDRWRPGGKNRHFIYALSDPRDGKVRYIGRTDKPRARKQTHISTARRYPCTDVAKWISGLLSEGVQPSMHIVAMLLLGEPETHEYWFYNQYLKKGTDLLNYEYGFSSMARSSEYQIRRVRLTVFVPED